MLTHFSLFSGIGGIDLAAEWAGFTTVGQCEFADYPTKVLEKHWPDVPRWRDVRDVTAEAIRDKGVPSITVLSGGFPCQPHSLAGEREASNDERDLWPDYGRIVCEIEPRWVLAENVPGILSSESGRFFGGILRDLAGMGYYAGWGIMRDGATYRLTRLEPVLKEKGFSLLPRPTASMWKGASRKRYKGSKHYKGSFTQEALRTCETDPLYINPNYVELLMGFPTGWTDLSA